jgi:outer membrane lipoprotein-sorting protein
MMRVPNLGIIPGSLLLAICLPCAAQTNAPPSLDKISEVMSRTRTILVRFAQERHLSMFNEPLRSEGFLCFQQPGRIRWETTVPYKSILVSDGSGTAQFEWTDEKWKKLDLGLGDALQNVLSQIAGVMNGHFASDRRSYRATLTNSADELVVTLVPQDEMTRKMMAAIEVHLAADLTGARRVVLRENGGDYTDIRFSEQFVNFEPPPKTFDRAAPADLEKIRAAAAGAKP